MSKFDVDDALVRKLAKLLQETGLTEIEFENNGQRIRVNSSITAAAPIAHVAAAPAAAPIAVAKSDQPVAGTLSSPMVGTAYLSPEPGAAPFVKVGDRVSKGQTVLIIEAMKVMNPIKAPKAGMISQVLVGDAQPVEFGEVLMTIE